MRLAALVAFFAVITAPMLWHVMHAGPLMLIGCDKRTCEQATVARHHGTSIAVDHISIVGDSSECPGTCSDISSGGQHAHVLGHHLDVQCKAWGGIFCQHKDAPSGKQ